jgi:sec-independent protein translocase protein TatA
MNVFGIGGFGTAEIVVVAIVGLLLYGRRLPEVGRTFGKTFFQFRRSLDDIRSEFYEAERMANEATDEATESYRRHEEEVIKEAQAFQPRYGSDDDLRDEEPDEDVEVAGGSEAAPEETSKDREPDSSK